MKTPFLSAGRFEEADQLPSPNFNERPDQNDISLLVIHCISLPEGRFDGSYVEELFCNHLDCSADRRFKDLEGLTVSSHLYIRRDGRLIQFVNLNQRAWHAGVSSFEGRSNCNDYSIGIELEGTDQGAFTDQQYHTLSMVTRLICNAYPQITRDRIVGHSDIAPERKSDPGKGFDWSRFLSHL